MAIPSKLALNPETLEELLSTTWNMRLATRGPGDRINLVPLWFAWVEGHVYAFTRGQKIANLRRDPVATVLVDRNERYPELQGAMLQGRVEILEDKEAEAADPLLPRVREHLAAKYEGGQPPGKPLMLPKGTAMGRTARWIRFTPERVVTWDNHKLSL